MIRANTTLTTAAVHFSFVYEDMRVSARGGYEVTVPDTLADTSPREPLSVQERDTPVTEP